MVICCGNFLSVVRSSSWPSLMRIVARGSQLPSDLPQITTAGIWPAVRLPQPHLFPPLFFPLSLSSLPLFLYVLLSLLYENQYYFNFIILQENVLQFDSSLPLCHFFLYLIFSSYTLLPFLSLSSTFPHLYKGPGNISLAPASLTSA